MGHHFLRANYPAKIVQEAFSRGYHKDRASLLNPPPREQEEDTANIFLITTYHPGGRILGDNVKQIIMHPRNSQLENHTRFPPTKKH